MINLCQIETQPDDSPSEKNKIKISIENFSLKENNILEKSPEIKKKPKRNSIFNKEFLRLRNNLNFEKISRKCQFDSLLKKVKAKFFKTIFEALKKCLNDPNLIHRLPQNFITNIRIEYNKENLELPLLKLYNRYGMLLNVEDLIKKNVIKTEKQEDFKKFISLPLKDVYDIYLNSLQFIKDCEKMEDKEGTKLAQLFEFIAKNIIKYYASSKGNKTKKLRNPEEKKLKSNKGVFMVHNKNEIIPDSNDVQNDLDMTSDIYTDNKKSVTGYK